MHIGSSCTHTARWTIAVTTWRPMVGSRGWGSKCKRWRDDIEPDSYWRTVNWYSKAIDRALWHTHAEAFVQQLTEHG